MDSPRVTKICEKFPSLTDVHCMLGASRHRGARACFASPLSRDRSLCYAGRADVWAPDLALTESSICHCQTSMAAQRNSSRACVRTSRYMHNLTVSAGCGWCMAALLACRALAPRVASTPYTWTRRWMMGAFSCQIGQAACELHGAMFRAVSVGFTCLAPSPLTIYILSTFSVAYL